MGFTKRNNQAPMLKFGTGEGQVQQVEGILTAIRPSTKYKDNNLYDIRTGRGDVTVPGSASINANLKLEDVGHRVRLTYHGPGKTKAGVSFNRIEVEVDEAPADAEGEERGDDESDIPF